MLEAAPGSATCDGRRFQDPKLIYLSPWHNGWTEITPFQYAAALGGKEGDSPLSLHATVLSSSVVLRQQTPGWRDNGPGVQVRGEEEDEEGFSRRRRRRRKLYSGANRRLPVDSDSESRSLVCQ